MANIIRRKRQESEREPGGELSRLGARLPFGGQYLWDPLRTMSELLRWDPFGEMSQTTTTGFFPRFDVRETQDGYTFVADLPGVREEDLDLSVSQNTLIISGRRSEEERVENEQYYYSERSFGEFRRSFTLPEGTDPESVSAKLDDGVLRIELKKRPEVQPRRVSLGAGKESPAEGAQASAQQPQASTKQTGGKQESGTS